MKRTAPLLALLTLTACELEEPTDYMGNYEVAYVDNLRVYLGDELVAEVVSGEDATVELADGTFQISTLCSDEGTECPSETFWRTVAVDQPWGPEYGLLNFVNLDLETSNPGARLGGVVEDDGTFAMLSGLALGARDNCAALGIGTVTGQFSADHTTIEDGVITYAWAAGCQVGEVTLGTTLRIETDYRAVRTGAYDVSSVTPEAPIDEDGETVDPKAPEEGYRTAPGPMRTSL